ncbi:MAG: hypothetical protein GF329_01525 [Candidatus Lokiarchaeota archaeon]|nr:hypothetical protein [Candidatus Lokiarchaeota archaeon]
MKNTNLRVLASESLGVRSFATYIKTPDINVLIDPGCALGPKRKHKIPHPLEYRKLKEKTEEITDYAEESDVIIISHYHNDHFKNFITDYDYINTNSEIAESIYSNKIVITKDPKNKIKYYQSKRAKILHKNIKKITSEVKISDNNSFSFGDTRIDFSFPVYHGEYKSNRGWVIMTTIEDQGEGIRIMQTSDVQGPIVKGTYEYIIKRKPNILLLDGRRIKNINNDYTRNLKGLNKICKNLVLDHHCLRDLGWKDWINNNISENKNKIMCGAEFNNEKPLQLEAKRSKLYKNFPISKDFLKWMNLDHKVRKKNKPPL